MNVLIIDNYDSFTYNLVHIVEQFTDLPCEITVILNDKIDIEKIDKFDKIILSPGPGLPSDVKILNEIIKKYAPTKHILGVCLGHQAIAETFGAELVNLSEVFHGIRKKTIVTEEEPLFKNIPKHFFSGRYHSWAISTEEFPDELKITAIDDDGTIMAISHRKYNVKGVQFHPESIMTQFGKELIKNWLDL